MTFTIDDARAYIAEVRWQFAKTMPQWPHEYTVKAWVPELAGEFEAFARLIVTEGVVIPWPPPPAAPRYHNHYLVIGDLKYWAMGPRGDADAPAEMTVINRSDIELNPWLATTAMAMLAAPGSGSHHVSNGRPITRMPRRVRRRVSLRIRLATCLVVRCPLKPN